MAKCELALALQGLQATSPTILVTTSSHKLATLKSSTRKQATLAKKIQALKTNYTKELVTTSLRNIKER
jgi:hypothetical protein